MQRVNVPTKQHLYGAIKNVWWILKHFSKSAHIIPWVDLPHSTQPHPRRSRVDDYTYGVIFMNAVSLSKHAVGDAEHFDAEKTSLLWDLRSHFQLLWMIMHDHIINHRLFTAVCAAISEK